MEILMNYCNENIIFIYLHFATVTPEKYDLYAAYD